MAHDREADPRVQNAERPVLTADDAGASSAAQTWSPLVDRVTLDITSGQIDEHGTVPAPLDL